MRKLISLLLFIVLISFWQIPNNSLAASGATLYLSPNVGVYESGDFFSIAVKVNTGGIAINAAEALISFPSDKLQVVSISKSGSIFALWTQDPVSSDTSGNIRFGGGLPSPGFTGTSGTLISITFKVKTIGAATVNFVSGAVLANDGKGTNILSTMSDGSYTLKTAVIIPEPPLPTDVPQAPEVYSSTHSNAEKWYSNNDPLFNWKIPSDEIIGVSILLHENAYANPGSISDGLIGLKSYQDIGDGVWYFHIKYKNDYVWGAITHRKALIDTQAPLAFDINIDNQDDPISPTPIIRFKSSDETSGIDYYEIIINEKTIDKVEPGELPYKPSPIEAGTHVITVKAFDRAGNFTDSSKQFSIESIDIPEITQYPAKLQEGDTLVVKGTSKPEYTVMIYVEKSDGQIIEKEVETNKDGNWSYIYDETTRRGMYKIWAKNKDQRQALSLATKKVTIIITLPIVLRIGKISLDYQSIMITLIILLIASIAIIFYVLYKISVWRRKLRIETKEVRENVDEAFRVLSEEVEDEISMLDKKPGLNKSEKETRDRLQNALNASKQFIRKEVEDVEKEIEQGL